jgi:hypothetical protein
MFDRQTMLDSLWTVEPVLPRHKEINVNNDWFGPVDAEFYYGMVQAYAPGHIIEVGSGHSTVVASKAAVNSVYVTDIISIDPEPRIDITYYAGRVIATPVQDVPLSTFDILGPGDFLFIDSSHIYVQDSDVDYLYNYVMPRLKSEVFIHIHDIFLPDDYPKYGHWQAFNEADFVDHMLQSNLYWPFWSSHYMHTNMPAVLSEVFPTYDPTSMPGPGSLWMMKR